MCVAVSVGNKPTGKLEDDGPEFARRFERLERRPESLPQLVCDFGRQISVVEVLLFSRSQGFLNVFREFRWVGLVTGKDPERLYVKDKVLGCALNPGSGIALARQ